MPSYPDLALDSDQESVHDLTTAIRAGDADALARFYESWFDFVLGEARRFTGRDESFCLDTVQEVMLRVIHSLKPMDHEASLRGWLRVVTHSCATDLIRRESRERRRGGIFQRLAEMLSRRIRTERNDDLEWLDDELEQLDFPSAHLLTMRYRFGWTLNEIGRHLDIPPSSVHRKLHTLTENLRRKAREHHHD